MYSTLNKLCCKILSLVVVTALLLPSFTGHASFELAGSDESSGGIHRWMGFRMICRARFRAGAAAI